MRLLPTVTDIFIFSSKKEGMPNAVLEANGLYASGFMCSCEVRKELIDIERNGIIENGDLTRL